MASNKNQHYVPVVHLKNFSNNERSISQIVLTNCEVKFISSCSIGRQCSDNYFYGNDDKFEGILQMLESTYGTIMKKLKSSRKNFDEKIGHDLAHFWMVQFFRSKKEAEALLKISESIYECYKEVCFDSDRKNLSDKARDSLQTMLDLYLEGAIDLSHIKHCLVVNKTDLPFFTSDNPAVLSNALKDMALKVMDIGSIFLLPLSPDLMYIGYDGEACSVSKNDGIVFVKNRFDIDKLNSFQIKNCNSSLYFKDSRDFDYIESLIKKTERRKSGFSVKYFDANYYDRGILKEISESDSKEADECIIRYGRDGLKHCFLPSFIRAR